MTDPKTHAQARGDRNCPTCRGTGVRDCSGSILYYNDGSVRSSSSVTTPCHCAKATPAVPDDVDWTACGIVEIAARNPSVMEYMRHWEGRAEKAEDDNRNLRAALERCLNFIDNTECELGMTLECGDIARAALNPTGDSA